MMSELLEVLFVGEEFVGNSRNIRIAPLHILKPFPGYRSNNWIVSFDI